MLSVRGGAQAVAFYERAFGAKVAYRIEDPDGNLVARLSIGGAEFWVIDESEKSPCPLRLGATTFRAVLVVSDVDAICAQAVGAGAKGLGDPSDAHGWRTGRVIDPFGHQWEIARELA